MLVRTYGLSLSEVGATLGSITIAASILGALAAAAAADKLIERGYSDGPMRAGMYTYMVALPAIAAAPLMKASRFAGCY